MSLRTTLCLTLTFLVSACCDGLHTHDPDGGSGGGAGGGAGGGVAGGSGGGGGGSGGSAGGGAGGSGGGSAGGGAGGGGGGAGGGGAARIYGAFQLSSQSLPAGSGTITGMSGRAGDVWAATDNSRVFHRTDGGFVELNGFSGGFRDIYAAPDGAVFLVTGGKTLYSCMANCTSGAAFTAFDVTVLNATGNVICGSSSSDVYAVLDRDSAIGILFHWDGNSWSQVSNNLGITSPSSCYMRPDGALFVGGLKNIVRWEQGSGTVETAGTDFSAVSTDLSSLNWNGISGNGDTLVAVGYRRRTLIRDAATGTWALGFFPVTSAGDFLAVGYPWPDEGVAAGSATGVKLLWTNDGGTAWAQAGVDLPTSITYVNSILVTGPNEVFFGGRDNSGPSIVRGKR